MVFIAIVYNKVRNMLGVAAEVEMFSVQSCPVQRRKRLMYCDLGELQLEREGVTTMHKGMSNTGVRNLIG